MTDETDDAMFEALLAEVAGGARPPDFSEQILEKLRRQAAEEPADMDRSAAGSSADPPAAAVHATAAAPPLVTPLARARRARRTGVWTRRLGLAALAAALLIAVGLFQRGAPAPVAEDPSPGAEQGQPGHRNPALDNPENTRPDGSSLRNRALVDATEPRPRSDRPQPVPDGGEQPRGGQQSTAPALAESPGPQVPAPDHPMVSDPLLFPADAADVVANTAQPEVVDPAVAFPAPPAPLPDDVIVARIDSLLRSAWQAQGVEPAAEADAATWRDRLTRLTGSNAVDAGPSPSPVAWVRRSLSESQVRQTVAQRFARTLLGPVGSARLTDTQLQAFASWLTPAIEGAVGFDALAAQLLTARGSSDPAASDFDPATLWLTSLAGPRSIPLAEQFGHAMLDVDLRCGRCHDHPLDGRVWQTQYWELNAIFQTSLRWSRSDDGALRVDREPGSAAGADAVVFFELPDGRQRAVAPNAAWQWVAPMAAPGTAEPVARQAGSLEGLAATLRNNPQLAQAAINRLWETVYGRPLVGSAPDPSAPPESEPLLQLRAELAEQLRAHDFDLGRAFSWIAAAAPMRLQSPAALNPQQYELASDAELQLAGEQLRQYAAYPPTVPERDFRGLAAMVQGWSGGPASLANGPDALLGQFGDPDARSGRPSQSSRPADGSTGGTNRGADERTLRAVYEATAPAQPVDWLHRVGSEAAYEQRALHLFYLAGYWNPSSGQLAAAASLRSGAADDAVALRRLWWVLSQERS